MRASGLPPAWAPPGTSWLGGGAGNPGRKALTLTEGFSRGVYPVTQGEWQAVRGDNPCNFAEMPRHPVGAVGMKAAGSLAQTPILSRLPRRSRLPTRVVRRSVFPHPRGGQAIYHRPWGGSASWAPFLNLPGRSVA
jgi:formylglycine-generating enzyme required for sulfatase activity